jgi:hypothetical protein
MGLVAVYGEGKREMADAGINILQSQFEQLSNEPIESRAKRNWMTPG